MDALSKNVVRRIVPGDFPKIAAINPFRTFGFCISSLKQKSTVGSMIKLSLFLLLFCVLIYSSSLFYHDASYDETPLFMFRVTKRLFYSESRLI